MLVILCTAPDAVVGARLARGLVDARLAACVNLVPGIRSYYRWQGEVHDDEEVQLLIKTTEARVDEVEAWVAEHHPYDVPELLALRVERGAQPYLDWVAEQTEA